MCLFFAVVDKGLCCFAPELHDFLSCIFWTGEHLWFGSLWVFLPPITWGTKASDGLFKLHHRANCRFFRIACTYRLSHFVMTGWQMFSRNMLQVTCDSLKKKNGSDSFLTISMFFALCFVWRPTVRNQKKCENICHHQGYPMRVLMLATSSAEDEPLRCVQVSCLGGLSAAKLDTQWTNKSGSQKRIFLGCFLWILQMWFGGVAAIWLEICIHISCNIFVFEIYDIFAIYVYTMK